MPAFPGGGDYPDLGMCGGLSAPILILLQTPFVHVVIKQIHDRKQLMKIGALSKVDLWASSLGTRDPLPHSRPWDESIVSRLSFPDSGNAT